MFVAFTLYGMKLYVLVVFLGLRMILMIVVVANLKEFSVESGMCLPVANQGASQGVEGQGPSTAGLPGPG